MEVFCYIHMTVPAVVSNACVELLETCQTLSKITVGGFRSEDSISRLCRLHQSSLTLKTLGLYTGSGNLWYTAQNLEDLVNCFPALQHLEISIGGRNLKQNIVDTVKSLDPSSQHTIKAYVEQLASLTRENCTQLTADIPGHYCPDTEPEDTHFTTRYHAGRDSS